MKKLNLKIFLAIAILFYSAKSLSQTTTTILYDASSNLSTTKCNVFDPPVNVGGKLHTSVIGAATFSTANGLTLPTNYTFSSGKTNRSDYRISYSFKSGYTYRIEVTAFGYASNSTAYPSLGASLFTAAGLTYTSKSCTAGDIAGFPQLGSVFIIQANNTPTVYSPPSANFTSPNNFDYLVLEATCQAAQDLSDLLYIQKIKIIETPPVSFTITPASVSITCSSTTPVTFTVNNGGGTTGITGYTWNLGTIPNGWILPNGTAAPATYSTGLTNTLMLTPVCGSVQKNVSATITANGNNYNTTNSATVSITQPSLSISGSSTLCSGSTNYSITGLPCNASISWTPPPAAMGTLSNLTSSPTTLTYGGTPGNFILTGTITACGTTIPVNKNITVGAAPVSGQIYTSPFYVSYPIFPGQSSYNICFTQRDIALSFPGANNLVAYAYSGPYVTSIVGNIINWAYESYNYSQTIRVEYDVTCGHIVQVLSFYNTCSGYYYSMSPNPSSTEVTVSEAVSAKGKASLQKTITALNLYDGTGNLRKRQAFNKVSKAVLNVSGLPAGVYYLEIVDGRYKERQKLIIGK